MELPAPPDAEAEPSLAPLELESKVLVLLVVFLLPQVTVDLVILLAREKVMRTERLRRDIEIENRN